MKPKKLFWLGLMASLMMTPICQAQLPGGAPSLPGAAGAAGVGGVTGAPASGGNLWSFLLPNADQKAACKTCFCNSAIGQLVSGAGGPFSLMSGGLIQNRCLQNSILNDLNKPADNPEGLAARVKADEEDAKARRAAVRFLGTVDCNYWPEAIEALRLGLRKDRNECVRFESALALRNGCCCNKEIIKALEMCITSSDADGFPKERSDRVRAAATDALMRCPMMLEETKKDDKQKVVEAGPVDPTDFYKKVGQMSHEKVAASARAVLASLHKGNGQTAGAADGAAPAVAPIPAIHQRAGSLSGIVTNAFSPDTASGGTRQPFFSGLTKALTGKQDFGAPSRQEVVPAAPVATPIQTPIPVPVPMPIPTRVTKLRETPAVTTVSTVPALPPEPRPLPTTDDRIRETRPLEAMPPLPPEPSPIPSKIINLREPRTVTPVEMIPTLPPEPTPIPPAIFNMREPTTVGTRRGLESTIIRPREVQPVSTIDIMPPMSPSGETFHGRPRDTKSAASPVEIIQTAPPTAPAETGPRETRGVVTIEIMPVTPTPRP